MKPSIVSVLITFALVCFALVQNTQAVSPAPDGGYGPPDYGAGNTAEGQKALLSLASGAYNTAVGWFSLRSLTGGNFNTAVGAGTLLANAGDANTATGAGALLSNTTGTNNTANGESALFFNTPGTFNTANGMGALENNTIGGTNTATGVQALEHNTTAGNNTANGVNALRQNTTASNNTAIGFAALVNNTTGADNTALGSEAGRDQTTGSRNVYIGRSIVGIAGESDKTYIRNINITALDGAAVTVDVNTGLLGHATSSRRYKEEIKPMDKASEALYWLKPVTFHYKKEINRTQTLSFGLIAEEVAEVNPDLIARDSAGKPETVRYEAVNAMLLNEFLKAHQKMEEQGATIAKQQMQIEALTAGLQKVSAQLETSKAAPQTVLNNQ
jgi:trimeric autotransporter adhesin